MYLLLYFVASQVDEELEIKAYYAGHVLGAAMVQIKVGLESVVYTVSVVLSVTYCCVSMFTLFSYFCAGGL